MSSRAFVILFSPTLCISASECAVSRAGNSTETIPLRTPARRIPRLYEGVVATCPCSFPQCLPSDAVAGFTLIELMIAMAIAAFLITAGLPSFNEFMRNSEIRSTTESIVNGLRLARSEAANRNQPVRFTLAGGGSPSWSIKQLSDNSVIQTYSKQEGGVNTTVAAQPAGAVAVTFNGVGRISPAALGGTPNIQQLDISSLLPAGSRPMRIYVDDGHGVRACDPSPELACPSATRPESLLTCAALSDPPSVNAAAICSKP